MPMTGTHTSWSQGQESPLARQAPHTVGALRKVSFASTSCKLLGGQLVPHICSLNMISARRIQQHAGSSSPDSAGGESVEDAAGSRGSEKASRRASSDVKARAPRTRQTTSAAPAPSEGQSAGSQSRQSGGAPQAEAEVETEVEAEQGAGPDEAEISKDDSEEPGHTPVVKDSLTAVSGPAKRRLPMLCQASHAFSARNKQA